MKRLLASAVCFVLCVTVVGAQGPQKKLTAAEQTKLFQRNRTMIQSLVNSSVDLSTNSNDYLKRSKTYAEVLERFHEEILNAAQQEDAGRVAELGRHLGSVIDKGLVPNLQEARRQIPENSTNWDKLKDMERQTADTLDSLQGAANKKWPESPEVRDMIRMLDSAKSKLKP